VIELDRHIEILLLSNDCVIIPGLGGFMAHHVNARYDEDEHLFLPPLRTLGFNPQLKMNDSLLVQSYVEAYDLSYPEALRRIEDEVEELKQHLENEGEYELNDLGILSVNEEGNYVFSPCEAGILTPELYGLGTFEMPSHKAKPTEVAVTPTPSVEEPQEIQIAPLAQETEALQTEEPEDHEERALVIKMSWIRNAVAVAAALLAFLLMSTPVVNSDTSNRTIGNLNSSILFPKMPKDTNMEKITIDKKDVEKAVAKTDSNICDTLKDVTHLIEKEETKSGYCIVLASYVSKKNANDFVERLQKEGYEESEVFIRNNVTRVIYGNFKTLNEAYNKLNRINHKKDFEEAWVMKL
jgi:cell division septation protein DedD